MSAQNKREYNLVTVEETAVDTRVKVPGVTVVVNYYGDTITKIYLGNKNLEIIENRYGTTKVRMVHSQREKFKGHWGGVGLGFNNFFSTPFKTELPQDASYLDLNATKSIEVALNLFQYDIGLQRNNSNIGLVTGIGLTLSNYRFNLTSERLGRGQDGTTTLIPLENSRFAEKNKMLVRTITVPLLLEFQVPDKEKNYFYINAGVYGGLNFSSHIKVKYSESYRGVRKEKFREDFNVNPFKYGAMVRTGYKWVNIYASCDLTRLFQKGRAPEIYPWSVGIMLVSF